MTDLEAKKRKELEKVIRAVDKITKTQAGIIFFRWLKNRCHFEKTTMVAGPGGGVDTLATVAREFERKIYLDIRPGLTNEARYKIEQEKEERGQKKEEESNV